MSFEQLISRLNETQKQIVAHDYNEREELNEIELENLDKTIQLMHSFPHRGNEIDPRPCLRSSELARGLYLRFQITKDEKNLQQSLELYKGVDESLPVGNSDRIGFLRSYCSVLGDSYLVTQDATLLNESIEYLSEIIDSMNGRGLAYTPMLNLGFMLKEKYFLYGEKSDFDSASSILSNLYGTRQESGAIQILIDLHDEAFIRSENETYCNESLKLRRKLRDMSVEAASDLRIDNLARKDPQRFSGTRTNNDLETTFKICRKALLLVPEDDLYYPDWLFALSLDLTQMFEKYEELSTGDEAIQLMHQILEMTDATHPSYPDYLFRYSDVLSLRYLRTRNEDDLDQAIQLSHQVRSVLPEGHELQLDTLFNHSLLLHYRYTAKGEKIDLDNAISFGNQIFQIVPPETFGPGLLLTAKNLHLRHQRTKSFVDLMEAIDLAKKALDMAKDGPGKASCLRLLSILHISHFQTSESYTQIDEAVKYAKQALNLFEGNASNRARFVNALALATSAKYSKANLRTIPSETSFGNVIEVVDFIFDNIRMLPDNHPQAVRLWKALGSLFSLSFENGNNLELGCLAASECFLRCLVAPEALLTERIDCARQIQTISLARDSPVAAGLLGILLVQEFQNLFLDMGDIQHWASEVFGLAADTAGVIMDYTRMCRENEKSEYFEEFYGDHELFQEKMGWVALASLGRARGILLSSILRSPSNAFNLETNESQLAPYLSSPEIALKERICHHLELGFEFNAYRPPPPDHEVHSRTDSRKGHDIIHEIVLSPEFKQFISIHSKSDVTEASKLGPIVVLNAGVKIYSGCDVFIIQDGEIKFLYLEDAQQEEIRWWAQNNQPWSRQCLSWLWDRITSRIMDVLGFKQPPSDNKWPHVVWIPTGVLTKFPFHASGRHGDGENNAVIDRVISSYSSTLEILVKRRLQPFVQPKQAEALLIAMENTPGETILPYASKEVSEIHKIFRSTSVRTVEVQGHEAEITSHLGTCNIFHFAGHGNTDAINPLKSHLCLEDKTKPLTVDSLLRIRIDNGSQFLAYLSACGTGRVSDERLLDESIHLISAFQALGFRHVLGTLWEVRDEVCLDVARLTYELIQGQGMTDRSVSHGLHKATRSIRDKWIAERAEKTVVGSLERPNSRYIDPNNMLKPEDKEDMRGHRDIYCSQDVDWDEYNPPPWISYVHYGV